MTQVRPRAKSRLTAKNERLLPRNKRLPKRVAAPKLVKATRRTRSQDADGLRAALFEAEQQQAATWEILQVMSSSLSDVQTVLDAVAANAARLCEASDAHIRLKRGDVLHLEADHGQMPIIGTTIPIARGFVAGRAVLEGRQIHIHDLQTETEEFPEASAAARGLGFHTVLATPLMREGKAIGTIIVGRNEVRPFSDKHISLVQTFAAQAVIAIESVRLFNETKEALERQTATAEILKVISGSPTNVQPVLDAIAESARQFCGAEDATVLIAEQGLVTVRAHVGPMPPPSGLFAIDRTTVTTRSMVDRTTIHVADLQAESTEYPVGSAQARIAGQRTTMATPLLREGRAVGAILLRRSEARPFTDKQSELLRTFADQAAIAIENVRLFKELEATNTNLRDSLEQQTATSEILKAISKSATDARPVFETIAKNARQLLGGSSAGVILVEDDTARMAAIATAPGAEEYDIARRAYPMALDAFARERPQFARVLATREPASLSDFELANLELANLESDYPPKALEIFRAAGIRSNAVVPMLRDDEPIGLIVVNRGEPHVTTPEEIRLLETFAAQAVVAIENTRLFNETKEALERQTATADILGVISSSPTDIQPVLDAVAERAARLCEATEVVIRRVEGDLMRAVAHTGSHAVPEELVALSVSREFPAGRAIVERRTIHIHDVTQPALEQEYPVRALHMIQRSGLRSLLSVPLMREDQAVGVVIVGRSEVRPFSDQQIKLLQTFAHQAVIAIENVRLFKEIQEKSRQLEVASKHKSDFLAHMSHELRTPLNAIIGFSEVLSDKMFGEVNEKQLDYLKDIHESGKHLLSLINDILDLSKIEAGRMELELSTFHLPTAISNALVLVRERAMRHGVQLGSEIDPHLAEVHADERKVKQILLNLLSNAVKFTPEGGRVDVSAKLDTDHVEIAIRDTGAGIAQEDQAALFEEFKQVGKDSARKAEGTGLGLALTKRFVELHGGTIQVKSGPGNGSTFSFTLPIRHGE